MLLKPHIGMLVLFIMLCLISEAFQDKKSGYDIAAGAGFVLWCIIESFVWVIYFFFLI